MSVYYDVYLHHKFLSFHLGERKNASHEKEKRERMSKEKKR